MDLVVNKIESIAFNVIHFDKRKIMFQIKFLILSLLNDKDLHLNIFQNIQS